MSATTNTIIDQEQEYLTRVTEWLHVHTRIQDECTIWFNEFGAQGCECKAIQNVFFPEGEECLPY